MQTKTELTLEQTQQGVSDEVLTSWTQRCNAKPSLATQGLSKDSCFISHRDYTYFYRHSHSELVGIEKVAVCSSLRLLQPKCTIETFRVMFFSIHGDEWKSFQCQHQTALRSNTSAGNPVKEILLQLNLPDHGSVLTDLKVHINIEMEIPSSSIVKFITTCSFFISKLIKLKNFKKDVSMSFQDKEEFEHVVPKVTKITRCKDHKMMKRLCLDDDLKEVQYHYLLCNKEQAQDQAHYILLQDEDKVQDYEQD
ncbi:hypothetical protein Tco_0496290 [Tanacetum coccineum]